MSGSPAWEDLQPVAEGIPVPRTYFSLVPFDGCLWLFGGFGDAKSRFKDLHRYDPKAQAWTKVVYRGSGPNPIYLHSASVHERNMFLFGGSSDKDSNKLYRYNFDFNEWTLMSANGGTAPCPRYGHASIVCNGHLIVTGGCEQKKQYFQDTHSFDLETRTWEKLQDIPQDMAYHSMCVYENQVYLFSGYNGIRFFQDLHVLDWELKAWRKVDTTGSGPPPRCGCAVKVIGTDLWVFAGFTHSGHNNDLFRLDLLTMTWANVHVPQKPHARAYLKAACLDGYMFIFGGYDGKKCVSDFQRVRLGVDMVSIMREEADVSKQVEAAMKHFARGDSGVLDAADLARLLSNIQLNLSRPLEAAPAASAVKAHEGGKKSADFDEKVIEEAVNMGFEHAHVMAGLRALKKEGRDVKEVNVLLDTLLNRPELAGAKVEPPAAPELSSQDVPKSPSKSSQKQLKSKLENTELELSEIRTCKICFDATIDCAITPCGHLASCVDCAQESRARKLGCPVCRKEVSGHFAIFWS